MPKSKRNDIVELIEDHIPSLQKKRVIVYDDSSDDEDIIINDYGMVDSSKLSKSTTDGTINVGMDHTNNMLTNEKSNHEKTEDDLPIDIPFGSNPKTQLENEITEKTNKTNEENEKKNKNEKKMKKMNHTKKDTKLLLSATLKM